MESPSLPTVKVDPNRVTTNVEADVRATLHTIPEIAPGEFAQIYQAALTSVRNGGDLFTLVEALKANGIPMRRAGEVSIWVNNRATAIIHRDRQIDLGLEAKWLYSSAPCGGGDDQLDASHKAANGQRYDPRTGMLINGRRVWPGQDFGCKCVTKSNISGFG